MSRFAVIYEQMKGRGTRTCSLEELKVKCSPVAKYSKDHFVIFDAIGVEKSQKTDSRPLEKVPGLSLKDILGNIAMGVHTEDLFSFLANRLLRMDKQINTAERNTLEEKAEGNNIGLAE